MSQGSELEPEVDATAPRRDRAHCPIVGIGASAGGIDALQRFFPAVEPDCGTAFVVVQHLDPTHRSILAEMLSRVSRIPVRQIENDTTVEPNTVYVIPPNATLTLEHGRLRLAKPAEPRGQRNPIDVFLISLARDQAENAACVILSGTGSDGTIGLRAIKENGGLSLAQADAEYDGMMRSAVGTGLVDFVLPAEAIPANLANYFRHLDTVGDKKGPDGVRPETADHLTQIAALLRTRTGHDFKDYKDSSIARRVQRRMQVLQIDDVPTFIEHLRNDARELDLLFQDLLIGVTNFFRDPPAFEALQKQVIPRLFEGKRPDDTVRVWVPGCATGEEAYSIAILFREFGPKSLNSPKLQVFASDIDEQALETARFGRYPATIAKDVPPPYLERYFLREDGTYRVLSDLREICLFSAHNFLRDAPFSRLDLISCRNLLIYLNAGLQDRIIPLFHYALREDGFLFLGTSENVTQHPRLFAVVDKANRIFRRRPTAERHLPEFPLTAPDPVRRRTAIRARVSAPEATLADVAERLVLERYAPAYVVVNPEGDILYSSSRTGKYLELPAGAPEANILNMARRGLRMDLRAVLHKAVASTQPVAQNNVLIDINGGQQSVDLVVQKLRDSGSADSLYLVLFQDVGGIKLDTEPQAVGTADEVHAANVKQLETELSTTKERLQRTTEELESSNEELKSSNEELSSMNEELQSANEELETSREELQSINEELQTVNAELNTRIEELSRSNNDIANLLESTQIATVFLDRNMRVKTFTPAAKDVFHLVESDVGRPIMHVRCRFHLDTVQDDAERVLRTLNAIEKQVDSTDSDARYIMRMLPYRTVDNMINGVVITFTDVTRITAAEARIDELTRDLRNRIESLETLLDLVPVGILIEENSEDRRVRVNRYGARLLGETNEWSGLKQVSAEFNWFLEGREIAIAERPLERATKSGEMVPSFEGRLSRADGTAVDVMISATPLFDEAGQPRGAIAAVVDISDRKQAEHHQQVLLHELQHRVKNILATITSLASRMLKSSLSMPEFSSAFVARLRAMGRMHDLLFQRNWTGAELKSLITAAVSPYATVGSRNIDLNGPVVLLKPATAAALGMVFHELATNAAKYGALADAGGHLKVSWDIGKSGEGERLNVTWLERLQFSVRPPDHEGFGTSFITRSVEYELEGSVELAYDPQGLRCAISFPLDHNVEEARR